MTILVTGARGGIGREVLAQLLARGASVRASVRDPAAAELPAGVPVVAADLTRPETLPAALDGVRQVFLYSLSDGIEGFVKAAEVAGVEHVVLLSSGQVLMPEPTPGTTNAIGAEHRAVERALSDSGLRWTPIRPLALATNALHWAWAIRAGAPVRLLYPDALSAPVHERDVAAVAVAALDGVRTEAVSAVLTGPELISQRQEVDLIAQAIGRPVRIEEMSEEEGRAHLRRFLPPPIAGATVDLRAAARDGGSPATTTASLVLGRAALPFAQWARDHVADFR
jgi:uncharacterized protein YbjT (DUF2867 family)